jgi:solute carrier family 13 (sodium-dependent dicarboxylate transporter), member 2/3/5
MPNADSTAESIVEESAAGGEAVSPMEAAFERWRKIAGVILTPIVFVVTYFWTARSGLQYDGRMLSAILAAVAVLWMTESLPLPVTSLVAAVLCIVLGVAPSEAVLAPFADKTIFLFMASFILAQAMMLHGLDRRIALRFLSLPGIGASPARVMAGIGAITAILSMWVSNTATTAMMLPIALGVLGAIHHVRVQSGAARGAIDVRSWPFATGMMLIVAYAASIGGIGTPVGSPPNITGIAYLKKLANVDISFFQWMALMVPMMVVMLALLFLLLYRLHPSRDGAPATARIEPSATGANGDAMNYARRESSSTALNTYLAGETARLGPWTRGQYNTLIAFSVAVSLWVFPGILSVMGMDKSPIGLFFKDQMNESVAAMIAAVLLFILPTDLAAGQFTMTWREAAKIDWGTLLLFGGGLSLGVLMKNTQVADALGRGMTSMIGAQSVWALTAVCIVLGIFLSETTSNTAAAAMIVPVVIPLAISAGVSPVPPVLGAVLGASYGFMLPVSTPPNAIVYGSGLVPIPKMVRAGFLFDIIGAIVIFFGLRVLCPLFGYTG